MVDVAEGVKTDGTADTTPAEITKARARKHKLDTTKDINRFLDIFKIALKIKKKPKNRPSERVNWYKFSEVGDGWMIKYEIEGFIKGHSMGTRPLKFYVSEPKKKEIEKFVDEFPKRSYQDTRTHTQMVRPERKEAAQHAEDMLLNLDDIWDLEKMKELSKKKAIEDNKDVWAS
ncbi:hypothetical protein LCGC14_1094420 [marine sediment metagenome]|uniref:Uncharacterized protein n=1 Tax=marine sediment metagenome TaxID=412755 RepID=A0A0F9QHE0_9ZZZZ